MNRAGSEATNCLLAFILLAGGVSCHTTDQSWEINFDPPGLEETASRFLVEIRAGGCGSGGRVLAEWETTRQAQADFTLALSAGHYSVSVGAVNADCQLYAAGCAEVHLPRREASALSVVLQASPAAPRCPAERCVGGRCSTVVLLEASPPGDGGTYPDVRPPVGGFDADVPADAAPEADVELSRDSEPDGADAEVEASSDGAPHDAAPESDVDGDAGDEDGAPGGAGAEAGTKADGGAPRDTTEGHDSHRLLDAERYNSCSVREGLVWCWGDGGWGSNGDGTNHGRRGPVQVVDLAGVRSIALGDRFACALNDANQVWCWGGNQHGQLGQGHRDNRNRPQPVAHLPLVAGIAAGGFQVCARTVTGEVFCWGDNQFGQLGIGTTRGTTRPAQVQGLSDVREITVGQDMACALNRSGQLRCWGANWMGERGDNDLAFRTTPGPVAVEGLRQVSTSQGWFSHTCGLTTAGVPKCWGGNWYNQLGDGSADGSWEPRTVVMGLTTVEQVVAGRLFGCALDTAGTPWSWGVDGDGRLGRSGDREEPAPLELSGIVEVAAGQDHTCARNQAGQVWCWGEDEHGRLGYGPGDGDSWRPTPVAFP